MYWHQAAVEIRREFPHWLHPEGTAWRLPATATDEERLLASIRAPLPSGKGLVAIWTRRPDMEGLLADACRRAGYATAWMHPRLPTRLHGAVAAVYDGASLDDAGLAELSQLTAEISPAPVLALLDCAADPGHPSRPNDSAPPCWPSRFALMICCLCLARLTLAVSPE